jgi:hypothetical protein
MEVKEERQTKWDWKRIEELVLSGKSATEIAKMDEFMGLNAKYLANQISVRGLVRKRQELAVAGKKVDNLTKADRRAEGVEKHYAFSFEMMERLRRSIRAHKVEGSVKELRQTVDLFQSYLDAADKSYGLRNEVKNDAAASLNAMIALHILPPSKAEPVEIIEVKALPVAEGRDENVDAPPAAEGEIVETSAGE